MAEVQYDGPPSASDLEKDLLAVGEEAARLREALRDAPMPFPESVLTHDEWEEAYDQWWHRHASEEALMLAQSGILKKPEPKRHWWQTGSLMVWGSFILAGFWIGWVIFMSLNGGS